MLCVLKSVGEGYAILAKIINKDGVTENQVDFISDQNTGTGVGYISIWTGTLTEYKGINKKSPNTIYHVRG